MNYKKSENMKTNIFLAILLSALITVSCSSKKEKTDACEELLPNMVEMNDEQYKAADIELGNVEQKVISSELKVNGLVNVSPQNLVSISAIMGGYIKSTSLVQGSPVAKGQVVAMIENPEFIELQRSYLESKSKLEYAEAEFNRQRDLNKENINSAKTYQMAVAEYKSLQSTVCALDQKLMLIGIDARKLQNDKIRSSISVVSPISGYVKTVNVNVGKYVNPTDVIVEIVNTQNLTLELTIFEKDIDKVSIGQKISFNTPGNTVNGQSAIIYQVGKAINSDKTVKAYASVEKSSKSLLPGMYVNATVQTTNNSVTALPSDAVLSFEDKNYIFAFSEKKKEGDKMVTLFKLIEVKKGASSNGFTEVILPAGFDSAKNKIVIKGAYSLLSAMKNAGDMAC
jgi:membrane fusion protein, heavy metal efflux system